jgi:hypothetical protein
MIDAESSIDPVFSSIDLSDLIQMPTENQLISNSCIWKPGIKAITG